MLFSISLFFFKCFYIYMDIFIATPKKNVVNYLTKSVFHVQHMSHVHLQVYVYGIHIIETYGLCLLLFDSNKCCVTTKVWKYIINTTCIGNKCSFQVIKRYIRCGQCQLPSGSCSQHLCLWSPWHTTYAIILNPMHFMVFTYIKASNIS
jgi:hypothetical protein